MPRRARRPKSGRLPTSSRLAPSPRHLPPTAFGRSVENRIIEYLTVLSDGELIVCRPESDIEGTDLHVNRRYGRTIIKIQVKGRAHYERWGMLQVEVKESEIPPQDPNYVLVAEYFPQTADYGEYVWLVLSDDYRRLGRESGGYWRADMSPNPRATDRWVPYRYPTKEIARVVGALLDRAETGQAPLRTAAQVREALLAARKPASRGRG